MGPVFFTRGEIIQGFLYTYKFVWEIELLCGNLEKQHGRFIMSLWLQSLSFCLDDTGNDSESRAKCIFSHLSMDIPRLWWERALAVNGVDSSYANILHDFKKELLNIPELVGKIDSGLLVFRFIKIFTIKQPQNQIFSSGRQPVRN